MFWTTSRPRAFRTWCDLPAKSFMQMSRYWKPVPSLRLCKVKAPRRAADERHFWVAPNAAGQVQCAVPVQRLLGLCHPEGLQVCLPAKFWLRRIQGFLSRRAAMRSIVLVAALAQVATAFVSPGLAGSLAGKEHAAA
eukprot:s709_g35.t1